jgi:uncharacterized membrane protein YvlD (DUF360 family)
VGHGVLHGPPDELLRCSIAAVTTISMCRAAAFALAARVSRHRFDEHGTGAAIWAAVTWAVI